MAKVEIIGTVDIDQFWPRGDSDADTVVVRVKEFHVDGEQTRIYDNAYVLNHGEPHLVVRGGCVPVR